MKLEYRLNIHIRFRLATRVRDKLRRGSLEARNIHKSDAFKALDARRNRIKWMLMDRLERFAITW